MVREIDYTDENECKLTIVTPKLNGISIALQLELELRT